MKDENKNTATTAPQANRGNDIKQGNQDAAAGRHEVQGQNKTQPNQANRGPEGDSNRRNTDQGATGAQKSGMAPNAHDANDDDTEAVAGAAGKQDKGGATPNRNR